MSGLIKVYKPTRKGIKQSGEMEPNDRYLFVSECEAIIYDATTFRIIEPYGWRKKDSFTEVSNDPLPQKLKLTVATQRQYPNLTQAIIDFLSDAGIEVIKE